jgi:hypothetical protein
LVEAVIGVVFFSPLRLLLDIVEYIGACNLNPVPNDIAHVLLLDIALHYGIVRADMFDGIRSYHGLILRVASKLKPLTLQVIEIGTFHAHRDEDLVLVVETTPPGTREGKTRHVQAIALDYLVEGDLLNDLEAEN